MYVYDIKKIVDCTLTLFIHQLLNLHLGDDVIELNVNSVSYA